MLSDFWNFLSSKNRLSQRRVLRSKQRQFHLEPLEDRRVLTAAGPGTVTLDAGVLTICGTDDADNILIVQTDSGYLVQAGFLAESQTFAIDDVNAINVTGGDGNDDLFAPTVTMAVTMDGEGGNDEIVGGSGDDILTGGAGNDLINGLAGDDSISGVDGDDHLVGGDGDDVISGGEGNDTVLSEGGDDTVDGNAGVDIMVGGSGNDILTGGDGNDLLVGEDGGDTIDGGNGVDTICGDDGNDVIFGGEGDDALLLGGFGNDYIRGGIGDDGLIGGPGNDILLGEAGEDTVEGSSDRDLLIGGEGLDHVNGVDGDDILVSGATSLDSDREALESALDVWGSADSYQQRVSQLMASLGSTVATTDDGTEDVLLGAMGQDWFVVDSDADNIIDLGSDEVVTGLELIALDDVYTVKTDTTLTTVKGVDDLLLNDNDPDGSALTVLTTAVSGPSNGNLTLNADGTFVYTPDTKFTGEDEFEYQVMNTDGDTATATVRITVSDNTAPAAVDDNYTVDEDAVLSITDASEGLLANDSDADGDTLTVNTTPVSDPDNGMLTLNADGTFTYTPNANFNGTDSFEYEVTDGDGGVATAMVTIAVSPVADAPTAVDDSYSVALDTVLTVEAGTNGLLDNDSDADGDSLSVNTTVVEGPEHGSVTLNADGSFEYTPETGFAGTDTFVYELIDATGMTSQGTVTIVVGATNNVPNAVDDSYTMDEDGTLTVADTNGLLMNDNDKDGDTLSVVTTPTMDPANGMVTLNADGSFVYTPNANFHGTDTFEYEVVDGAGGSDTATVTITISAVNDNPTLMDDTYQVTPGTTLNVDAAQGVLANDTDVDGDTLKVNTTLTVEPVNGTVTMMDTGAFEYVPNASFVGTDSFTYEVTDGNGGLSTASVEINVNTPPVAVDDAYTIDEDVSLTVEAGTSDLLSNDSDPDGDDLVVLTTAAVEPENGTVVLNADGSFSYVPEPNFAGTDSFQYEVSDGNGDTATATVTITVNPLPDPPVAVNDAYSVEMNTTLTTVLGDNGLLDNDFDPDGDTLTIETTPVVDVANGTLTINADGTFEYIPTSGFSGMDSFEYRISDGNGGTSQAVATISVLNSNDPPVAGADAYSTDRDTPLVVSAAAGLLINDSDADGDVLTVNVDFVGTDATNGTVTLNADGSFTYTPNAGFSGTDSFTYQVVDPEGLGDEGTVTITVNDVNTAPVAVMDMVTMDEDETFTAVSGVDDLLDNDSDINGDTLTVETTPAVQPSHGDLTLNSDGTFTYTPESNYHGMDSFAYTVTDGNGGTAMATVMITINSVNDIPIAENDVYQTTVDTALQIDAASGVLANDSDVDGDKLTASQPSFGGPTNGTVTINSDGSFTFTPDAGFVGMDTFLYEVADGNGGTQLGIATITVVAASATEDVELHVGLQGIHDDDDEDEEESESKA